MDADFHGLLSNVTTLPDSPETCPAVKPGERCRHGWHELAVGVRPCPMERYRSERKRLAQELALCGYGEARDEMKDPVGPALFRSVDPKRDAATLGAEGVKELRAVLERLDALRLAALHKPDHADYRRGQCNIALIGSTGTAKTMLNFALYFAWLRRGLSCHWLEQGELIRQAKNLASGIEGLPESAQSWLASIKRYKILFLSDLAAQKADKSTEPGTSPLANLLLTLLSSFSGRVVFDSNLNDLDLRKHPDIGVRIVSRLFADRGGSPCEVLTLWGADQRQHLLRSEKR